VDANGESKVALDDSDPSAVKCGHSPSGVNTTIAARRGFIDFASWGGRDSIKSRWFNLSAMGTSARATSYCSLVVEWTFVFAPKAFVAALQGGRKAWASALKRAGIPFFPIYNLRHTFASRMTGAGVSTITIARMLGHASTQIVPRYAQVLDQNRLDAVEKMEAHRHASISDTSAAPETSGYPANQIDYTRN